MIANLQPAPVDSPSATAMPSDRQGLKPKNPLGLFLVIILAALLVEIGLDLLVRLWFPLTELYGSVVDATTLLSILAPLLYFLFVRPMFRTIQEKSRAELALQAVCEGLEERVQSRTSELEAAYRTLENEVQERIQAALRSQIQGRLLNAVPLAAFATAPDGGVTYWNRFAEELFGWSKQQVLGQGLPDLALFPAEALPPELFHPATTRSWEGEIHAARRDASTFPAHLIFSPIWMPDSTIGGFAYTLMDITDRREAEEALRNSEEKFSTVVANSPTGIFLLQNERIVFANQRFYEMVACTPEDVKSLIPSEVLHPEDWPKIQQIWQRRYAGEKAERSREFRFLGPGGKIRWFSGRSALIHVDGQDALVVNVQDVTERHETEEALRSSQIQLQKLSAGLFTAQENERRRVAQQLQESLGQSLSAIKFTLESAIEISAHELAPHLIKHFRAVVPLIQGTQMEVRHIAMALRPPTLDELGLLTTFTWFVREFENTYPGIEIDKHIEIEEAEVPEALKANIFRILQEAMTNSARHGLTQRIRITLRRRENELVLQIADEGVGFDLSHVKGANVQGSLGLHSMQERAELFGGQCSIVSTPGEGTVVTARWPVPKNNPLEPV